MKLFLLQAVVPAAAPEPDFRRYVFGAYGAVIVCLFFYFLWIMARAKRAERLLESVRERVASAENEKKRS